MQEVIFTLQTITPMFLAGAEQKKVKVPPPRQPFRGWEAPSKMDDYSWQSRAELRVPSFRGLLRYWQRAVVGGLAKTNTERLKQGIEAETKVFGMTDKGSIVHIRVSMPSEGPADFTEKISEKVDGQWRATGKGYLLWSMSDSGRPREENWTARRINGEGRETKYKPPRQYYDIGTSFSITLSVRGQNDEGKKALKQATAAMWLLTQLGGVGSRSRRCAGSLAVTRIEGNTTNLSFVEAANSVKLQNTLGQGIQEIRGLWATQLTKLGDASVSTQLEDASFDILSFPDACRIWILQQDEGRPWDNAKDVMSTLGESLQSYRNSLSLRERTIFGLPLIIRGLQDRELKKELEERRRASPLLLKVTKLQGEHYVGIAVLFKTNSEGVSMSDYALIEKWVAQDFPKALQVAL